MVKMTFGHRVHCVYRLLAVVAIFFAAIASGPVQGASFSSSLGDRPSACPDETVTYVCVAPDPTGGFGQTQWNGTIFEDQCPMGDNPDQIRLGHQDFILDGMESVTCGVLMAEIVARIGTGMDSEFNSTLTVNATAELDDTTVVCSGPTTDPAVFVEIDSDTLLIAPVPPPNITITELSPTSVRVSVPEYPEETLNCDLTFTVEGTTSDGVVPPQTSNTLSVDVPGLELCINVYTFNAIVSSGGVSSGLTMEMFDSDLITLNCATNLTCGDVLCDDSPQTLRWDAPTNLPDNCDVAYQIEVDDGMEVVNRTTTMGTSLSVAGFGLPSCEKYNITVTPDLTDRIGLIRRCSSHQIVIPAQGFPIPTVESIEFDDFCYGQQGIMVTISWDPEPEQSEDTMIDNVLVNCSRAVCPLANLTVPTDPMGMYSTNLDYSGVIGESVDFTVTFVNEPCQTRDTTTRNFPNLLDSAEARNVDRTSADILVVFNTDVNTCTGANFMLLASVSERDTGRFPQSLSEMFPPPPTTGTENQFVFMFTGLTEGVNYEFEVRVENGDGQTIGRVESGTFRTTEESEGGGTDNIGAIIGGVVGGLVAIVAVIGIVILCVVICCCKKDSKSAGRGSGGDEERHELQKSRTIDSGDAQSSPEATDGGDLNYAIPGDIKREEFPGTHEQYTVVDKSRKKPKPEDTLPTYAAPDTIPREKAPETGDLYTVPDKPKKGSRRQAPGVPPPEEAAPVYSAVDKSKKQPGIVYADVELPGSNTTPARPPRVDYSSVQY